MIGNENKNRIKNEFEFKMCFDYNHNEKRILFLKWIMIIILNKNVTQIENDFEIVTNQSYKYDFKKCIRKKITGTKIENNH